MKTPIAQSKHDLHECYGKRVVSTIAYNLPYRIARHKKKVYETINTYPKGTFFVITNNGERPKNMKNDKLIFFFKLLLIYNTGIFIGILHEQLRTFYYSDIILGGIVGYYIGYISNQYEPKE